MIEIIDTHTDKALVEVEYCVNGGDLQTCMIPVWRVEDYYYTNPINWIEDRFEPSGLHIQYSGSIPFDELDMRQYEDIIRQYMEDGGEITEM
jgi:hypothetical protein